MTTSHSSYSYAPTSAPALDRRCWRTSEVPAISCEERSNTKSILRRKLLTDPRVMSLPLPSSFALSKEYLRQPEHSFSTTMGDPFNARGGFNPRADHFSPEAERMYEEALKNRNQQKRGKHFIRTQMWSQGLHVPRPALPLSFASFRAAHASFSHTQSQRRIRVPSEPRVLSALNFSFSPILSFLQSRQDGAVSSNTQC